MNSIPVILTAKQASIMLKKPIISYQHMEEAAPDLITLCGKPVFIKGDDVSTEDLLFNQHFWTNGEDGFWLANDKQLVINDDAFFLSVLKTCITLGYAIKDALVIASMFCRESLRSSEKKALTLDNWPEKHQDLPYLSPKPLEKIPDSFTPCSLDLYPVVDSSYWVETVLSFGVSCIQLRIKDPSFHLEEEIKISIAMANKHKAKLFINDHWALAMQHGAYGVHLGQQDLEKADINAIRKSGLHLGISTHCYSEVARAHALHPSYMACGPIYRTTSKIMPFEPQGIEQLHRWRRTLSYPLVAIGGINIGNIHQVLQTGVQGISLISAITKAGDPQHATHQLLRAMREKP